MIGWLTETDFGKLTATFLISMLPVVELRGGLPFGMAQGLHYPAALTAALLGNFLPAPMIILYIKRIFAWLRRKSGKFDSMITYLEKKAHLKGRIVQKYSFLGLVILVGIPLPGTGVWTGSLVAAILDMRVRRAAPAILLGLLMAAAITTMVYHGVNFLL